MAATIDAAEGIESSESGSGRVRLGSNTGRSRSGWFVATAALTVAAGLALTGTALGAGGFGITQADIQRFSADLNLTRAQTPQVNSITLELVGENNAIFAKYGVDVRSCSNLGPFRLSALNNEAMAAYSRARAKLSQVLSAEQLSAYGAIYAKRRQETKNRIVCGPRQAQR